MKDAQRQPAHPETNQPGLPPKLMLRLFRWYCAPDCAEDIEGDLWELFEQRVATKSTRYARLHFTVDVLRLCRPGIIRKPRLNNQIDYIGMIKHYLKVAMRLFKKEKSFTAINVVGLALALTCALFIYLWIDDEVTYNTHATQGNRICRIWANNPQSDGSVATWGTIPYPMTQLLEKEYPEVEALVRVNWVSTLTLTKNDEAVQFFGNHASPEIFEMFDLPFIQGNAQLLKENPQSVAISASMAANYFGADWASQHLTGKAIHNAEGGTYQLAGVFQDVPKQSTLKFDFIIPYADYLSQHEWLQWWGNFTVQTYILLANGTSFEQAQANLAEAYVKGRPDGSGEALMLLQPFKDLYLYNHIEYGKVMGGRISYVRLMGIAALLILVIASINFINLATARAGKRAKETGVRKALGVSKFHLQIQFITESILIAGVSMLLACALVLLLLPVFNNVTGKTLTLIGQDASLWAVPPMFALALGILSGIYPAFYISSFNTIKSLKGGLVHGKGSVTFRKVLVVFQFVVTITMIVGTLTVYRQMSFIRNKHLGFNHQELIGVSIDQIDAKNDFERYRRDLLAAGGIEEVTVMSGSPLNIDQSTSDPTWVGKGPEERINFNIMSTEPHMIATTGMQLIDGRNFDPTLISDTANYLINEAAARAMGMTDPVGKTLDFWEQKGQIIGLVKDFHHRSLHEPIGPIIFRYDLWKAEFIIAKTKPGQAAQAVASLKKLHEAYTPKSVFSYSFLDDVYQKRYANEAMVHDLTVYFTVLAIVISILGLLGLVAYQVEQRTKEFSIRKVLGATFSHVMVLVSKSFLVLVTIALIVSVPLAWYIMNDWLQKFAYRVQVNGTTFVLAALGAISLSAIIIFSQVLKTSKANLVESLRDE